MDCAVKPADATNRQVKWTSSDTSVVTVDDSGRVLAKGVGSAVITAASANGVTDSCTVTVSAPAEKYTLMKQSDLTLKDMYGQICTARVVDVEGKENSFPDGRYISDTLTVQVQVTDVADGKDWASGAKLCCRVYDYDGNLVNSTQKSLPFAHTGETVSAEFTLIFVKPGAFYRVTFEAA